MVEVVTAFVQAIATKTGGGSTNLLEAGMFVLLFFVLKRTDANNKAITKLREDISFIRGKLEGINV